MVALRKTPKEWLLTNLGTAATYLNGRAFKPSEWEGAGIPIIRIQNLNDPDAKYNYSSQSFESRYKIYNGDLLFAWSASLGAYIWKGEDAWLNQHIFKVIPGAHTDKHFLYFFLNRVVAELYAKAHGSGMVHVTKGVFEKHYFPLPPLPEQRAIVSKIEQLLSDLDNGIASFKVALEQLKVYRQSVLKWAFEGKLTEDWRKKQKNLSDAKDLLEQIRIERERLTKVNGTKVRNVYPIAEECLTTLPELTKGWIWVKLGEIALKITDGEHVTPQRASKGVYLLSARNIQNGYLDLSKVDYIPYEEYERIIKRCYPQAGDILISCSGSIGRVCAVPKEIEFTLVRSVALVKLIQQLTTSKFMEYCLQSPLLQRQIDEKKKATAQANIFLQPISELIFPLCSVAEQYVVVQEIETRLSVCDNLEENINQSLQTAEALRQSILKKAFEGRLLSDVELENARKAPDWEPADSLLERIKAERTSVQKPKAKLIKR